MGKMAVSLSSSSDSEHAPCRFDDRWWWWWSRLFDRCLCILALSGATLGVDWWCEWCDFASFRFWAHICASIRCSRSLSVSLWQTWIFCLWRCFRFFSETLRCMTPLPLPVLKPPGDPFSWKYSCCGVVAKDDDGVACCICWCCCCICICICKGALTYVWSGQRCCWFLGVCRECCFACDNVWVSHKSLCDTTKLLFMAAPMLTRRCCSAMLRSVCAKGLEWYGKRINYTTHQSLVDDGFTFQ